MGLLGVLVALGAVRELLGNGTLLSGMSLLFGARAEGLQLSLPLGGIQVAVLPPGAFFGMALLLALYNVLRKKGAPQTAAAAGSAAESAQ